MSGAAPGISLNTPCRVLATMILLVWKREDQSIHPRR
jgi:hypothetical protein